MELVILLDEEGNPTGTAPKSDVHGVDTPLHLAFSCYLLDADGRVLVTRRSLAKRTWPGVWTNSFCGHPAPGEKNEDAVVRRAAQELGVAVRDLQLELPDFRYRAVDASGIVEYEVCPVYTARIDGELRPAPDEVAEWAWIAPDALRTAVVAAPFAFSPWMREQLALLATTDGFR
ncbi:isopentenyl-diphosphate Delta-isomerase [Microbacterium sp. NPDC055903]